ncbi:MAG: hypothetical protein EA426_17905 [Spirochaetaceae bacterium]|nr:MAG: hypothetical protein EA426_17905 [Spirochaetaceae bacterium]
MFFMLHSVCARRTNVNSFLSATRRRWFPRYLTYDVPMPFEYSTICSIASDSEVPGAKVFVPYTAGMNRMTAQTG